MRFLLTINGFLFGFFLILSILPHGGNFFMRSVYSLSALSIVFFLPGWNIITLASTILRKYFSLIEFVTLSIATSFIIPALILTLEHQNSHLIFPTLPIINSIIIFLATVILLQRNKSEHLPFDILEKNKRVFFLKLLTAGAILYTSIIGSMVTAYYPLPDLDPYYWISQSQTFFTQGHIPTFSESRPLFIALTYLFSIGAKIDLYAFFKYIIPLLSVFLIFPAALIAENFRHPLQKAIAFLLPFTSGIIIIFLSISIPQAIASILTFFVVALTIRSKYAQDSFFYFFAGALTLLGYFFHEAFIIPFIAWILTTPIVFRHSILSITKKHSLVLFLSFIILLPYLTHIGQHTINITQILLRNFAHIHPNFLFPQQYINVDGNQMGWGDMVGVAKYYLFYVGPALLLLFCILPTTKRGAWGGHFRSPQGLFLSLTFFFLLLIAEIFPRFIGMAFLPDRAWIFGDAFALGFFPLLFDTRLGKNKWLLLLFIVGFSLNIGAALYINTLKKYVITSEQLSSADWINTKLPTDRVIFTIESGRLLSFFSGSQVISVKDPNFLFDEDAFTKEYNLRQNPFSEEDQKKSISQLKLLVNGLDVQNTGENISTARSLLDQLELIEHAKALHEDLMHKDTSYYVYYAAPNMKNPYLDRPYMKKIQNNEDDIIMRHHPEKFQSVYSDEKNHIFLWKILP